MTWTKLSDDYSDDCWTLSDKAFRLHTEALIWSNRKLLDCVIPEDDVRRFAKNPEAAPELVDIGWWTHTDDGHYVIRHHASYQRTREAVVNQQSVNQANGKKGGRPRKPGREQADTLSKPSETESLSETETERDGTGRDGTGLGSEHVPSERDDVTEQPLTPSQDESSSRPPDDDDPEQVRATLGAAGWELTPEPEWTPEDPWADAPVRRPPDARRDDEGAAVHYLPPPEIQPANPSGAGWDFSPDLY